eukprot:snap_masked-scaffold764_size101305-processed-gene-0.1 protein:Tk04090 transcript:snap_masked-scaffold764_size101305-processed-gene-0.1-mRNA-1 annotation:"hypothetical protein LOTGIDRAFT_234625"
MASDGPEQMFPSEVFTTSDLAQAVKLRVSNTPPDNLPPISVPQLLTVSTNIGRDACALAVKRQGAWVKWSYDQYQADVRAAAKGFIQLGLETRYGVAIAGFNAPEWFIAQLGAIHAHGVSVGIYPTSSGEACRYILEHSRSQILVVEDQAQLDKFEPFLQELTYLKAVIMYEGQPKENSSTLSWGDFIQMGRGVDDARLDERLQAIAINECCHLVYTSGTTGMPKGAMLSHDNLTWTGGQMSRIYNLNVKEERIVSYLPLSHVAANITDLFLILVSVGTAYFADKDALKGSLMNTVKEVQPTFFLGVPRVWEKIRERMLEVGQENKGLKQKVGNWAKRTGLETNMKRLSGDSSGAASLQYKLASKLVFSKVKQQLGFHKCTKFFSSAAPLAREVIEYFLSLDIRILEIYGMTECSGPHLCNTYQMQKVGAYAGETVGFWNKIDGDQIGEICIKGRHVMMGYLKDESKTRATFDKEGWLKSGDTGTRDSDGFVSITGRIKELIITAGGENIAPVLLEDNIKKELPCISNAVIIGEQRKFISCLLTLKTGIHPETMMPLDKLAPNTIAWIKEQGIEDDITTVSQAINNDLVKEKIQAGIERANAIAPSRAQQVKKWVFLPEDFSVPGGELGPTLKLKRHMVTEKQLRTIEKMYK